MIEDGLVPELLLGRQYGHSLHFWELDSGRHLQRVDLGNENQMVLELRPAHDPEATWGFTDTVVNVEDLSASVWLWNREGEDFVVRKVITVPAEPAQTQDLPPALQPFGAVPPLITDIDLSVDDQWLYVSAWGTGELLQYDVSDPFHPRQTASVRLGGITGRQPHPAEPENPLTGGAQMVELSRDGRRVYLTNSLYAAWDAQIYPRASTRGWSNSTPTPCTAGSPSTAASSHTARTSWACACTKRAWKAATPPRIRTATAADRLCSARAGVGARGGCCRGGEASACHAGSRAFRAAKTRTASTTPGHADLRRGRPLASPARNSAACTVSVHT